MRDHESRKPGSRESAAGSAPQPGRSTQVQHQQEAHAASVPRIQLHDVKGGADNVDLTHLNNHPGFDPNRIGDKHHDRFHTKAASPLYRNDGQPIGTLVIPAGAPVYINAGAITKLVLHEAGAPKHPAPPAVDCVYIWNYEKSSGWMPASCLPHEVTVVQHEVAGRIEHQREDKKHGHEKPVPIRNNASAESDGVIDLFTYPHQGVKKHHEHENEAKYYYGNLALNLPDTDGPERVGVISVDIPGEEPEDMQGPKTHRIDPYREFYPEEPRNEAAIPLYAKGSREKSGKSLHFLYGFVKDDSGSRLYGWINTSMLGHAQKHDKKP